MTKWRRRRMSRARFHDRHVLQHAAEDVDRDGSRLHHVHELLQRLLVGVPLEDHRAAASACVAFRDVINGPKFLALRRQYGFAERGVVLLQTRAISGTSLKIRAARKNGDVSLPTICSHPSTTDGGSRLFISSLELVPNQRERIMAVDVSSCRWKCVTALPMVFRENSLPGHCMEWHGGLLYVAGGRDNEDNYTLVANGQSAHNSLHVFNETTDSWEELPPMPHATAFAASGVIGNELFVAGGRVWHTINGTGHAEDLSTLQIYDFTTRTWRLGPPLPRRRCGACGIVVDGKLYLVSSKLSDIYYDGQSSTMVYDVQSNTWTELPDPPLGRFCAETLHAFAHNGSIVVVYANGTAFHRGTGSDPDWYPFDLGVTSGPDHGVAESVILG